MSYPEYTENWTKEQVVEIENRLLQGIFQCRSTEAVEAAVTYSSFLSTIGVTPENCPLFLKILEIENHWVIDALIGERDPFLLLSSVQPNAFIVHLSFGMMTKWFSISIIFKNRGQFSGVIPIVLRKLEYVIAASTASVVRH